MILRREHRTLPRLLLVMALLPALAGCIGYEEDLWIERDGSGRHVGPAIAATSMVNHATPNTVLAGVTTGGVTVASGGHTTSAGTVASRSAIGRLRSRSRSIRLARSTRYPAPVSTT